MSDRNERACTLCGSLIHHEARCPQAPSELPSSEVAGPVGSLRCDAIVRRRVRKLRVMTCDLVSCRGGLEGCNGSECRRAKWQKMTPAEYQEHFRRPAPNGRG